MLNRSDERDITNSARHEAAHATVAIAQEIPFFTCLIYENEDEEIDPIFMKTWLGQVTGVSLVTPEIAIAGVLIEHLEDPFSQSFEEDFDAIEDELLDDSAFSATDLSHLPIDAHERIEAAKVALDIIRENQDVFEFITTQLVKSHYVRHNEIMDFCYYD